MQPLSPKKRRLYLYLLVGLFFIIVPIVILYASGYRFKGEFGFVQTGGIYLSVSQSGTAVSLNGEEIGESGILRKSFYISDLSPGSYVIQAAQEGYHPWLRTLVVESELVTDANILLVPLDPVIVELSFSSTAATTAKRVSREVYNQYLDAFDARPSTTTPHTSQGALFVERGNLFLRWEDANTSPPSSFCLEPSSCTREISIEIGRQTTAHTAFWGGGIVYTTLEGGVFMTEGDIRPTTITAQLYPVRGATFRIVDERLIIKDGNKLYEVSEL